jgi:hypothetical protein
VPVPAGSPVANPDEHPLLTARHVDNLTTAVHTLTMAVHQQTQLQQKMLTSMRELTAALGGRVTRDTRDNMAAIVLEDPK